MIAKLLGIVDLLAMLSLIFALIGYPIGQFQAGMAVALIGKGTAFLPNALSITDIVAGLLMFGLLWHLNTILAVILACWLGYKGIYSLL